MRHVVKTLGLSLLTVVCLAALIAGPAQAIEVKLAGKTFTADGVASETILGTVGTGEYVLKEIKIEFRCTGAKISGTVLLGATGHAHILFEGCAVFANGVKNIFCKIYPTAADRTENKGAGLKLFEGLVEVQKVGGTYYLTGASAHFATVFLTKGSGCTLPPENAMSGSIALKLPGVTGESLNHTAEVLTEAEEEALGVSMNYGAEKGHLKVGTGTAMLNSDALWSVE